MPTLVSLIDSIAHPDSVLGSGHTEEIYGFIDSVIGCGYPQLQEELLFRCLRWNRKETFSEQTNQMVLDRFIQTKEGWTLLKNLGQAALNRARDVNNPYRIDEGAIELLSGYVVGPPATTAELIDSRADQSGQICR